ncbi:hypothetical protein, partial [Aquiflexum sp.]|uniref:hypothetical protein n=1 Tax=Aquiflexum sp. TaxID=1872584 RepID=UPI0035935A2F
FPDDIGKVQCQKGHGQTTDQLTINTMRKLSEIEIQPIKDRLDSLQIAYLEIYNELLDHYISELEQKSPFDFHQELEHLNETFAWSVVKKMESDLEKNNHKQVAKMQWECLKFWNFSANEAIQFLVFIAILVASFLLKDIEGIFISLSLFSIFGIILALKIHGKGINFSLRVKNQKPVNCISKIILMRLGLIYGCLSWFWVGLSNWGNSTPGTVVTFLGILIASIVFLYIASLIKVSIYFKKPDVSIIPI